MFLIICFVWNKESRVFPVFRSCGSIFVSQTCSSGPAEHQPPALTQHGADGHWKER